MRALIIGEMDRNEQLYLKLRYSDEVFEINMVVSEDRTSSELFQCGIITIENLEKFIISDYIDKFVQDYDIVFLCSQEVERWRRLLIKWGIKEDKIKLDMQLSEFLSPKNNMDYLSEYIHINTQLKYQNDDITVGEYSYGIPYVKNWTSTDSVVIGKFCSIAENVQILLGESHRVDWITTFPFNVFLSEYSYIKGHPMSKGNIIIGNDVWIGGDVKIMSGVTIGDGAVLAANALVTKDVEPYTIVGGIPAHVIKKRFPDEIIKRLLEIKWWDWDKELIYEAVPLLQSASFDQLFEFYDERVKSGGSC